MTTKVLRFHEGDPPPVPVGARGTRATALTLPGLPLPRFTAVDVVLGDAADGLLVEEVVLRGTPGASPYKMMSFGRRNPALSRAEFVERWRADAGRLGSDVIPDDVRGLAYVQDHPLGDDPPFDAVNEVWLADLDALRRRAEWFAARPIPADLMDPATCGALYLVEEPF